MMIMEEIASLEDAEFDKAWQDCKVQLQGEGKSILSNEVYGVETEEELKQFIKDYYLRDDKIILRLRDGDTLYLLWAGYIEDNVYHVEFTLPCNVNGSKSWLYSEDFKTARKTFYDSKGLDGARTLILKDSLMHSSILNRIAEGSYEGTIEDHPLVDYIVVVTAR